MNGERSGSKETKSSPSSEKDGRLIRPDASASQIKVRSSEVTISCWKNAELRAHDFKFMVDSSERTNGLASASILSVAEPSGPAAIYQTSAAMTLRGKRVELSADLRTRGARRGASLWLRAEDAQGDLVAYNLTRFPKDPGPGEDSPDAEWSTEHVVLDIPDDARVVTYGILLGGAGQVWVDNMHIDLVSLDVPTTGDAVRQPAGFPVEPSDLASHPRNLDFELNAGSGDSDCS